MFGELVILAATIFVWIINRGKKSFNDIHKNVSEYITDATFKIIQIVVIIFCTIIMIGVLGIIYSWIKTYSFSN